MSAYWKFDPYKDLGRETPAKVAKVAKERPETLAQTITLAGLATLAARPAENASSSFSSTASLQGEADEARPPLSVTQSLPDIPSDWASGLLGIVQKPCPIIIEPKRWLQLQGDANRFIDRWGRQAAALALDIFGCHPVRPSDRPSGRLIMVSKSADVHERILIWDLAPGDTDFSETTP